MASKSESTSPLLTATTPHPSVHSRPITPSPELPDDFLDSSPIHSAKPTQRLSQSNYVVESQDYQAPRDKFPRISRPVQMMRAEYDCVVIGSGYGGGVAASRSVRAGKEVCVLELGKEKHPGEYPVSWADAIPELHVSGNLGAAFDSLKPISKGDKTDLYNLVLGEGQNAFVGHGLGGTSLLNANVFLEADERTLQLKHWPEEIRKDPGSLKKYYDRAASVLEPECYPDDGPRLAKLETLKKQANLMGWADRFKKVPQTTAFRDGRNSTGVMMKKSQLLGQDSTGVNDGSKKTTLVTYIADAWYNGAEIFCECEVRYIKQAPGGKGWIIFFAWHGDKREKFEDYFYNDLMWVHARECVFLGAGTLGTTEILLRSRERGLSMSDQLGSRMSGNGDILAFGYNTDEIVNSMGSEIQIPGRPVGPTITGAIDMRDAFDDVLDGFVLEEGAVAQALTRFLQTMLELIPGKVYPDNATSKDQLRRLMARAGAKFIGPYTPGGALDRTQVYLIMTHDSNEATLTLTDDKPYLRFYGVGRTSHVQKLNELMAKATTAIGGTFVNNPFNIRLLEQEQITVHPIGGAVMSKDGTGEHGAVNHIGEVFVGEGEKVHDGLVVVDGAVIPGALGVNPFATITALAERSVEGVAKKRGWEIDFNSENGPFDFYMKPKKSIPLTEDMKRVQADIQNSKGTAGARFTEIMEGFVHIGEIEAFDTAYNAAKAIGSTARFYLSVDAWNTRTLVSRKDHASNLTGTFTCAALSPDPFLIQRGTFKLFTDDSRTAGTKNLVYDFDMIGTDGRQIHFYGYKEVNSKILLSVEKTWRATTTLFVKLTCKKSGNRLGKGKLEVSWRNFASELTTFEGTPGNEGILGAGASAFRFLNYLTGSLSRIWFTPFGKLQYPHNEETTGLDTKPTLPEGFYHKAEPVQVISVVASDGIQSNLYKWNPPTNVSPRNMPILFVPGSAVDYKIFHLPTVRHTPIDYFLSHGYTVYSVVHRTGRTPLAAKSQYTVYDQRLDIAAAIKHITEVEMGKSQKLYVIAHCTGSIALAAGLLDGTIPTARIAGITASAVFAHTVVAKFNRVKTFLPYPAQAVWAMVRRSYFFNCVPTAADSYAQHALDQILRFYPICQGDDRKREVCNSVVCHRSSLIFGRLWNHTPLNFATHVHLDKFMGGINRRAHEYLVACGHAGLCLNNERKPVATDENIKRLKGVEYYFVAGRDNEAFSPEGLVQSADAMRKEDIEVRVDIFEKRGHLDIWMGDTENESEGAAELKRIWKRVKGMVESAEEKWEVEKQLV